MIGNSAHGDLPCAPLPGGQNNFQLPGSQLRIIKEHLIEIPQAKKQNRIRQSVFYFFVLFHHRS